MGQTVRTEGVRVPAGVDHWAKPVPVAVAPGKPLPVSQPLVSIRSGSGTPTGSVGRNASCSDHESLFSSPPDDEVEDDEVSSSPVGRSTTVGGSVVPSGAVADTFFSRDFFQWEGNLWYLKHLGHRLVNVAVCQSSSDMSDVLVLLA